MLDSPKWYRRYIFGGVYVVQGGGFLGNVAFSGEQEERFDRNFSTRAWFIDALGLDYWSRIGVVVYKELSGVGVVLMKVGGLWAPIVSDAN